MVWFYVCLLLGGAALFTASFFIPEKKKTSWEEKKEEKRIREIIEEEMKDARTKFEFQVEEVVDDAVEKAERSLERVSNEKIMAVNEYSDTVLDDINKNHQEVVFLYDMLNDKHDSLISAQNTILESANEAKALVDEVNKAKEELISGKAENVTVLPEKKEKDSSNKKSDEQNEEGSNKEGKRKENSSSKNENVKSSASRIKKLKKEMPVLPEGDGGNKNAQILKLLEEGKSNVAIAKELGMGVGEVNLVINLFKQG